MERYLRGYRDDNDDNKNDNQNQPLTALCLFVVIGCERAPSPEAVTGKGSFPTQDAFVPIVIPPRKDSFGLNDAMVRRRSRWTRAEILESHPFLVHPPPAAEPEHAELLEEEEDWLVRTTAKRKDREFANELWLEKHKRKPNSL